MLLITLLAAGLAVPTPAAVSDAKTMAHDSWHQAKIVAIGTPLPGDAATYLEIHAGDFDGDGVDDDAYLKLTCDDGKVTQAWYEVKSPRDLATGQASGKRQHQPVTFVKEWGAATPRLSAVKPSWNIKTNQSARTAAGDEWTPIDLANTDGLCAAAGEATRKATKTRSNIQNN